MIAFQTRKWRWLFASLLLTTPMLAHAQEEDPQAKQEQKALTEARKSLDSLVSNTETKLDKWADYYGGNLAQTAKSGVQTAKSALEANELPAIKSATQKLQGLQSQLEPSFGMKFMKTMDDGGIFMWLILTIFGFGVLLIIERSYALLVKYSLNAEKFFEEIRQRVTKGDIKGAIQACEEKGSSALAHVLKAALKKAGQPERVIQDSVDEADLEMLPKLQARTPYLSMIANVATLMGLLGTILGLISAFAGLAHADPSQKQAVLAQGIAIAMNTTAFGLVAAIPCMISHALLMGRTNGMIQSIDEYSVKLINLLLAQKNKNAG